MEADKVVLKGVELKAKWEGGKVVLEADLTPASLLELLKGHGKVPDAVLSALEAALGGLPAEPAAPSA